MLAMPNPTTLRGPRSSDDWLERVRAASDILEVVGQTVQLKRSGRSWVGLCPFHAEKTPSFSVSGERQLYHCYGCKAGGDVFKFVQEIERVDFLDAAELLSRRAGIAVPERRAGDRGTRNLLLEALEQAATAYSHWLDDPQRGAVARAYLERRGVTADGTRAFRLGLAPEGWDNLALRLRGRVPDDALVQAGLAARRESGSGLYDRFRNRLMIPLIASGGVVVGFGARALGDEPPKYLNSPETPVYHKGAFLFALDQARKATTPDGEMIVVEGYFDAIALHRTGLKNTVATAGTALTPEQARSLKRLVRQVALTYDGDAAGREAMMRSLSVLLAEGLDVVVVDLPQGEDPDTLVRTRGLEGWHAMRAKACDPVDFVQRHVLRATPGEPGRDPRERALQAVVRLASEVREPIHVRLLLQRASEVFGLDESVLVRAVEFRRRGQNIEMPVRAAVREQQKRERGPERALLRGLLHAPEDVDETRQRLSPEDFVDPACRALALWIWSGSPGLPDLEPAASLARELLTSGIEHFDWRAEVAGATRKLVERRLRRQLKDRRNQLGRVEQETEAARLMQEIDDIARSLRELGT